MPLPTLAIKGHLRAPNGDKKLQKELDEWIPFEYINKWFKDRWDAIGLKNRILIVKAETASGKSTLLPAEIYRNMIKPAGKSSPGIICTQPRTLTAIRNVLQIINIPEAGYDKFLIPGDTIGWSTRFNKIRTKNNALLSVTIGTLTQQLSIYEDSEIIKLYRFIIIDETHERDLETDITLYMLKNFMIRNISNPKCPFIILMSATFDPSKFITYFDIDPYINYIWCEGRTIGYEQHWDWNEDRTLNNYTQAAADVVEKIIHENPEDNSEFSDILIFMPGRNEIKQTSERLSKLNEKLASENIGIMSIMKIDSEAQRIESIDYKKLDIPLIDQQIFINGKKYIPTRRVIIATNFAETGITIPSLKYVIDSGFNKEIEYNPNYNVRALIARPAPKSRITQRMGRVGRLFYGHFYPLYPQYIHNMLPDNQFPQILLEDISPIMLDIINEQLKVKHLSGKDPEFLIEDIDMIDIPSPDALHASLEKLYILGFISPISVKYNPDIRMMIHDDEPERNKFGITKLGAVACLFKMTSPESIRMILAAYSWNCSILNMITIAAYLAISSRAFIGAASTKRIDEYVAINEEELDSEPSLADDLDIYTEDSDSKRYTGRADKPNTKIKTKKRSVNTQNTKKTKNNIRPKTTKKTDIISEKLLDVNVKKLIKIKKTKIKPEINWMMVYKMGAPDFLRGPHELYKLRMLLADEFIDAIFLFDGIKRVVARSEPNRIISELQTWCKMVNINYDTVVVFIRERDNIIEQMLTGGLEIFLNEEHSIAHSNASTFMDIITRIKYCIYDGYRLNILTREGENYYTINGHLQVNPPELFSEDEKRIAENTRYEYVLTITPQRLLYHELNVKYNQITSVYDVVTDTVSALDGFVNIDDKFAN